MVPDRSSTIQVIPAPKGNGANPVFGICPIRFAARIAGGGLAV